MNKLARVVGIVALVAVFLLAGGVAWAAVSTWQAGVIRVSVRDRGTGGTDVNLALPAVALDAALAIVPEKARAEIELDAEAARALTMLSHVCTDLERKGDFVLVEVVSGPETVRVEKRGDVLLVKVDSPEESVRVEIPIASIARLTRWLDPAGV